MGRNGPVERFAKFVPSSPSSRVPYRRKGPFKGARADFCRCHKCNVRNDRETERERERERNKREREREDAGSESFEFRRSSSAGIFPIVPVAVANASSTQGNGSRTSTGRRRRERERIGSGRSEVSVVCRARELPVLLFPVSSSSRDSVAKA